MVAGQIRSKLGILSMERLHLLLVRIEEFHISPINQQFANGSFVERLATLDHLRLHLEFTGIVIKDMGKDDPTGFEIAVRGESDAFGDEG